MKKLIFLIFISFSVGAACKKEKRDGWYFGGDFQIRRLCYKECPSGQKIINYSPRTNGYVGHRFNDYFGIEIGYGYSVSRNKGGVLEAEQIFVNDKMSDSSLNNNANSLTDSSENIPQNTNGTKTEETESVETSKINGRYITQYNQFVLSNKLLASGLHLNLVGFYPLPDFRATELIGSIGVFNLRTSFTTRLFGTAGEVSALKTIHNGVPIIRITGGIQSMITRQLNLRFVVGWMNTSHQVISYGYSTSCGLPLLPALNAKDTLFYGVGLNWKF
jgi:hypothetical protein